MSKSTAIPMSKVAKAYLISVGFVDAKVTILLELAQKNQILYPSCHGDFI
jgi:hypothetical protein